MVPLTNERNAPKAWEDYFAGGWEQNNGRRQTQLFAKYWLETVILPVTRGTLLDVGCAMGDAAPIIHRNYPELELSGLDVSSEAIQKAVAAYGDISNFRVGGFSDISKLYDIILCSNTLEHFTNYLEIAKLLSRHCRWLYILVPYKELKEGKPLSGDPGAMHVATFDEHSFDELVTCGAVRRIRTWLHPCPIAWAPLPSPLWKRMARSLRNRLLRRPRSPKMMEIFYELETSK